MTYSEFAQAWKDPSDYIIAQTSGSTGVPKEIEIPKIEMINSAQRTIHFFGINQYSVLYSAISPNYIGGKMMYVRSIVAGCKFSFEEPSNRPLQKYSGPKISLISVVPSQMDYIIENPDICNKVEAFLIGGAPLSPSQRSRIIAAGVNAYESYGMTETASHIAIRKISEQPTNFIPLPGIEVCEKEGCLNIKILGWREFQTNDIASIHKNGSFQIIGRKDNMIISGGIKINPEMVEAIISNHFSVPFYIAGLPDDKWGQSVALIFAASEDSDDSNIVDNLIKISSSKLEPYFRPKILIQVESLPLTPNGKIKRIIPNNHISFIDLTSE